MRRTSAKPYRNEKSLVSRALVYDPGVLPSLATMCSTPSLAKLALALAV